MQRRGRARGFPAPSRPATLDDRGAKEKYGTATGDEELRDEGRADQASGNLKQAGENVKDVFT